MTSYDILWYSASYYDIMWKKLWHLVAYYVFAHIESHNLAQDVIIWKRYFYPTTFQHVFNTCRLVFLFKNFEWRKYPYFLKKLWHSMHIMIFCIILWHLVDKNYDFLDIRCHNMNIGCYNFNKEQKYFRHTKFLNEKMDQQVLNAY